MAPEVPKPHIVRVRHDPETLSPTAPQSSVVELEVAPFSEVAHKAWSGRSVLVLSLRTEHGPQLPFRFCLSAEAAGQLVEELQTAIAALPETG